MSEREVYRNIVLLQETTSNKNFKQHNLTPKATRERGTNKTQLVEGKKP